MNSFQSLRLIHELYFKKGLTDLELIQSYGLLAVKIGQLHALRLDFLPAEKCEHLAQLYRAASPIPTEDIYTLLSAHGGPEFRKQFSFIDTDPVAVASVGQVYRATLADGTPVAIKVIKKNFKERWSLFVDVASRTALSSSTASGREPRELKSMPMIFLKK
jgi:ubiquinone biosynthesis protein